MNEPSMVRYYRDVTFDSKKVVDRIANNEIPLKKRSRLYYRVEKNGDKKGVWLCLE